MSREQMIVSGVERWASRHPCRDTAVLVVGSRSYSPQAIAEEIRTRTPTGMEMLELFAETADRYSLEEVLDSLDRTVMTASPSDRP
jgi:hypothetical protein